MANYILNRSFECDLELSMNVLTVASMFGLDIGQGYATDVLHDVTIKINSGDVVLITGASGAGKSVIMGELEKQIEKGINLATLPVRMDMPLVDCFENESLKNTLRWLGGAGLCDSRAILQKAIDLSKGQLYRYKLAVALWHRPSVIFIDEFCTTLDRITAACVAHNIRKFADQYKTTFIVATAHDDLLEDLAPDVVVMKRFGKGCEVLYPEGRIV